METLRSKSYIYQRNRDELIKKRGLDPLIFDIQELEGEVNRLSSAITIIEDTTPGYRIITALSSFLSTDNVIEAAGAGGYIVTLLNAVGLNGRSFEVINSSTATVTIDSAGGLIGNIRPTTTFKLLKGETLSVVSNNTNWRVD